LYTKFKTVWRVLEKKNKKKFFILLLLLFFSGILDLVGVVSILPFLTILSDPALLNTNIFFIKLNSYLNFETNKFIIFLGFGSFTIIILNQSMRLFSRYFALVFTENLYYEKSRDLFSFYLNKPYNYFLSQNNAHLLQRCTNYVNATVGGYITPTLLIINSIFSSFLILLFLFFYKPTMTLIILFILLLFYKFFFKIFSEKALEAGKVTPKYFSVTSSTITDAFGSIKELILKKNTENFVSKYSKIALQFKKAEIKKILFGNIPIFCVEILAGGILLIIALYVFFTSENFKEIIPLVGVMAIALKRMIPAVQEIYSQLMQIKFYKPTFDKIIKDFNDSYNFHKKKSLNRLSKNLKVTFKNEIEFKKVEFSYQKSSKPTVYLSNKIKKGDFIGVCGKSGHGKTTFLDIFCGLLNPNSGKILVDGLELKKQYINSWQKKLGYAPQSGYVLNDTIENNIIFGGKKINDVKEICKIVELSDFIEKKLAGKYNTKLGENGVRLSGGQQQRLILARALYCNPEVIILDEATNALDNTTESKIIKNIKKNFLNTTIIFVTHRIKSLAYCNKILLLDEGKIIAEGKYNQLIKNNTKFKKLSIEYKKNILRKN